MTREERRDRIEQLRDKISTKTKKSKAPKNYFRVDAILEKEAQYNICMGERSNGKSYAVKEYCVKEAYEHNKLLFYLRRYDEDLKKDGATRYFSDCPVRKITHGDYDGIKCYGGYIRLTKYDTEEERVINGPLIGYYGSLNTNEGLKSRAYNGENGDVGNVIFEEMMTKKIYIPGEPLELLNTVSTIARDNTIKVWMISNTVNRVCPYFQEWQLKNALKMKPGDIDIYTFHRKHTDGSDIETRIALQYCDVVGSDSKMFFGAGARMITGGEWETYDMPKLPREKKEYEMVYELLLKEYDMAFVVQLLVNKESGGQITYVYPFTGKRNIRRIVTSEFSDDPFVTPKLSDRIKAEQMIRRCTQNNKVCYSDNLTGTDFTQVLKNRKGGL